LTKGPGPNTYPHWSPDGKKIAFHAERDKDWEIYVMDADGKNEKRLTMSPGEDWIPSWSPDGKQIAFWSTRNGDWEVYVMRADGLNPRKISNEESRVGNEICRNDWAPDGKSLLISTDPAQKIVQIDLEGKLRKEITKPTRNDYWPI